MRHLPPIPWRLVRPGTVVLDSRGTPRRVLENLQMGSALGGRIVLVEGLLPAQVTNEWPAHPVELDTTDAIGNLFAADLTVTPIKE
ncbi:MAG: hypothetical protein ABW046_22670 [Actinoplanes sp.]